MPIDYESLFDGLQVEDDLLVKAQLRIQARPLRNAIVQALAEQWQEKYKERMSAMMADIRSVLDEDETVAKSELVFTQNGELIIKAANAPKQPKQPKTQQAPKTVTATGERKLTDDGYVHVENPGSRGGVFYRDDKGNVRYGVRPQGKFQVEADPEHVVEHFRKYYMPQPFASHNQRALNEALLESDVLSEADKSFMDWWTTNYDAILGSLATGLTRTDVEKAGGLQNLTFRIGGRDCTYGEAIEELFRKNANLFVGDPTYGNLEDAEEVVDAVREMMGRYKQALEEDPSVQAAATAYAEKQEALRNTFYLEAERTEQQFSPLAGDVMTVEDPNDLALRMTVAMKDLGLIEIGKKGKVSDKKMRGCIVPKSSLLLNDRSNMGQLWSHDQLERLNASQLMATFVAYHAQDGFGAFARMGQQGDPTQYHYTQHDNEISETLLDHIYDKLGVRDNATKDLIKRKLEKVSETTLSSFNRYNSGQDQSLRFAMDKMKINDVAGKDDAVEQYTKMVADHQANIDKIIAAQSDTTFDVPPSMKNGVWNGKTLKDPKDPSKGVWAPFEYQKKYANWMKAVKRGVIAADAGLGKSLANTELVLTPKGFVQIGTISVGDFVIGKNGEATEVIGVFPQGQRDLYKVHFTDGTHVTCDKEHLWTVQRGSGVKKEWIDLKVSDILEEGWMHANGRLKFAVPVVDPVRFKPSGELRIDPYELGLLLGDGSLTHGTVFNNPEQDLIDVFKRKYSVHEYVGDNCCPRVAIHKVNAGRLLHEALDYYAVRVSALQKFVPSVYKHASIEDRRSILAGLLDSDGHVVNGGVGVEYTTISKQLAKDVAYVARSLGALVTKKSRYTHYSYKGERFRGKKSWRLLIRFLDGTVPVRSEKHLAKYNSEVHNPKDKRIEDIEKVEPDEAVCIKVAAKDGLFVTRGFTVTHNTPTVIMFREMLAAEGNDVPAICFLPPSLMEQWPKAVARFAPEHADKCLNLSGLSLEERKKVLQSDMAKNAKYIFISTGTLTGDVPDPNAPEEIDDGTGGSDHEMVEILKGLNGAVFIDEAHQGGYKKAGNTRHEIAKAVMEDREYAFGMTATPMPNDPMDVYHLANLFSPGSVGDEDQWQGAMAGIGWNEEENRYEVTNPERLIDLNRRLKPHVFYKAVTDPDVQADMKSGLPKRQGVHENPELHPDEGDLELCKKPSGNGLSQHDYFKENGVIDTMVKLRVGQVMQERAEKIRNNEIDPKTGEVYKDFSDNPMLIQIMAAGMKVTLQRQAAISPALIDPSYRRHDGGVADSPKLKAIADDIVAHFANGGQAGESGKPLVVFCSYPGKAFPLVRKILAERGIDPSRVDAITGEVAPHERGYMQDKLNQGHSKVLLVGTMSGGAGLNLQEAANKTLFLDEPWNPAAKRQAIGRVWRTGQTSDAVFEKTYRMAGTFDGAVEAKIAGKQAMVSTLLGNHLESSLLDPNASVKDLLGRVKTHERPPMFTEEQMNNIFESAAGIKTMSSHEHKMAQQLVGDYKDWSETLAGGGKGGHGAELSDKDYEPDKKASKELKKKGKGAKGLTDHFDEKQFRAEWEADRNRRRAGQDYDMANLMEKLYREEGNPEKADEYKRKTDSLVERFKDDKHELAQGLRDKHSAKQKADAKAAKKQGKVKETEPVKTQTSVADAEKKAGVQQASQLKSPVVKRHEALGIDFHSHDNPFKESMRKVKGSDEVTHSEAKAILEALHNSKHKSWDDFVKKEIEPYWDPGDDNSNKYTPEKGKEYANKIVDAIRKQGVLSVKLDRPKPEKVKSLKKTGTNFERAEEK